MRSTVITYVNPAVAAVLGVIVLNETFTLAMGIGFVLVILGSTLATRRPVAAPEARSGTGFGRSSRRRQWMTRQSGIGLRPSATRSSPETSIRRSPFMSAELHRNLGEVIALLPLPATEAAIDSVEAGGSGYNVVLRLVGETETVLIQTRWKDRDGTPTIIEASHLSKSPTAVGDGEAKGDNQDESQPEGESPS